MTQDTRTTSRPRHTSSAAACTDWSGRVQAHTRPALSQELPVQHRGRTMRWMCEPPSGVVDEPLVLLLLWAWVWSCPTININRKPTQCSGLAEHALHPGAVATRLRSTQCPRTARAEAARVGRWWPWLDYNGVTLFVQQYDRGTCCELPLAINPWYLVPGTGTWYHTWYVRSPYNTKKAKCLFLH